MDPWLSGSFTRLKKTVTLGSCLHLTLEIGSHLGNTLRGDYMQGQHTLYWHYIYTLFESKFALYTVFTLYLHCIYQASSTVFQLRLQNTPMKACYQLFIWIKTLKPNISIGSSPEPGVCRWRPPGEASRWAWQLQGGRVCVCVCVFKGMIMGEGMFLGYREGLGEWVF